MNFIDTLELLQILSVSYPHDYKAVSKADVEKTLEVWHDIFKDYDKANIFICLKKLIKTRKEPPAISEILDEYNILEKQEVSNWVQYTWHRTNGTD